MKLLFLRGQVPQDRDPRQIMFSKIEDCDDMWTQLAYAMSFGGSGQIWYWNGRRKVKYKNNFIERWISSFSSRDSSKYDFNPDVIFARGGFKDYDSILKRNKKSFKIYYGAGARFYPKGMYSDYDLILTDTNSKLNKVKQIFPKIDSDLLIKPVAENIFYPRENKGKKYDIILVGNYNQRVNKGHDFAFSLIPKKYKVLCVGIVPKKIIKKYSNVKFTGWVPRKEIPKLYSLSKIAIVCCGKIDSCPRVIPEALACNCPILTLDRINFNKELYISDDTGISSSEKDFLYNIDKMLEGYVEYFPYDYYKKNLSIEKSVDKIINKINKKH